MTDDSKPTEPHSPRACSSDDWGLTWFETVVEMGIAALIIAALMVPWPNSLTTATVVMGLIGLGTQVIAQGPMK